MIEEFYPMPEKDVPESPEYALNELVKNCEAIFKVKPEILAGALHGHEKNEYTLEEVRELIKVFQERRIDY